MNEPVAVAIQQFISDASRCPDCTAPTLRFHRDRVHCGACGVDFPVVRGVPILMRSDNLIFPRDAYLQAGQAAKPRRRLSNMFPWKSVNLAYKPNLARFVTEVAQSKPAHVLVIGCGDQRRWLGQLFSSYPHIIACYSDVDNRATVDLYCDAHDIPFQDGVFDGAIASAVLEHVLYPERVIGEMYRVLRNGGVVYSEIPFMQQVHEGAYDFTRYTHSGHRRAFHDFEEISSGMVAGPGTTLLWAIEHFALCFAPGRILARLTAFTVRTLFFWVKYFDYLLRSSQTAIDGASCTYFMGRKTPGKCLSDREIVDGYAGRQHIRHVQPVNHGATITWARGERAPASGVPTTRDQNSRRTHPS